MTALIEGRNMAKTKGRPKKPSGEGIQVRLDADLVRKARYLVMKRGGTVNDYFAAILRPVVERDVKKAEKEFFEGKGE